MTTIRGTVPLPPNAEFVEGATVRFAPDTPLMRDGERVGTIIAATALPNGEGLDIIAELNDDAAMPESWTKVS